MRRLVPLLLLALAGCDAFSDGEPVQRIDLDQIGENAATPSPTPAPFDRDDDIDLCQSEEFEGASFTHCVADPSLQTITTALSPGEGRMPYRSFASYRSEKSADGVAFAMNGGMFDDAGQPIGYYVEHGDRLKQLNRADGPGNFHLKPNGVFFGNGAEWQVLSADRFYSEVTERPEFGTQSGPMLVIDGEIHPEIAENGPSRLKRNAVGVAADGRAHFVISEEPVSFGVIARYFRDELKTPNALFLDGTVSSLWNPASGRMDGIAPLGPLIVVKYKVAEAP